MIRYIKISELGKDNVKGHLEILVLIQSGQTDRECTLLQLLLNELPRLPTLSSSANLIYALLQRHAPNISLRYQKQANLPGGTIARAKALLSSSSAALGLTSFSPCTKGIQKTQKNVVCNSPNQLQMNHDLRRQTTYQKISSIFS